MYRFRILANDYLSISVDAFYHVEYTGMGKPGNPDYLNVLKNTFNDFPDRKLNFAVHQLQIVLREDIPQIRRILGLDTMTVCVVPRAKAENFYHPNQQLFRATVQKILCLCLDSAAQQRQYFYYSSAKGSSYHDKTGQSVFHYS